MLSLKANKRNMRFLFPYCDPSEIIFFISDISVIYMEDLIEDGVTILQRIRKIIIKIHKISFFKNLFARFNMSIKPP